MKASDALLEAAGDGRTAVVKKLVGKRGKPATDSWKRTPLHLCAIDGHQAVAELLLSHGHDPNARDKSGDTPLLTAVWMFAGRTDGPAPAFIRLLLDHGADASAKNKEGKTTIDQIFRRVDGQGQPMTKKRMSIGKLLMQHGAPATPEQARRLGGSEASAIKAKLATFDWAALEAHVFAWSTKAITAFAKRHKQDLFYGFCFDCNAQMHGSVLCCLNTVEGLKQIEEKYGSARDSKWNPGNWVHQEFANIDSDPKWRARVAPLGDENGIELDVAGQLLESIARVAVRLDQAGAFAALRRTDDFAVFVIDHDEIYRKASARMKRARAAVGTNAKRARK